MTQVPTAVQRIIDAYATGSCDGLERYFTPDALLDGSMPGWRYQFEGPDRIVQELRHETDRGAWRVDPTITLAGDTVVAELDAYLEAEQVQARFASIFELRDGRIARWRFYCAGEWSEDVQRRIEAEAPKVARAEALV